MYFLFDCRLALVSGPGKADQCVDLWFEVAYNMALPFNLNNLIEKYLSKVKGVIILRWLTAPPSLN